MTLAIFFSSSYATVAVTTRKMQSIHYAVVLFYYSIYGFFVLGAIVVTQSFINNERIRLLTYTWHQFATMFGVGFINTFGIICQTIASQNEKSGVIQLFGYITLVYGFLADIYIFD